MVQLVQSSVLQVWMTILHNDTLQSREAPEQGNETIEKTTGNWKVSYC